MNTWVLAVIVLLLVAIARVAKSGGRLKPLGKLKTRSIGLPGKGRDDLYWELLSKIEEYQRAKEYGQMLECCRRSIPVLPVMVVECKRTFGRFDIIRIPAIEIGCRYWAALEDRTALNELRQTVSSVPALKRDWGEEVENALTNTNLCAKLKAFLEGNPGCLQNKIAKALGVPGQSVTGLIHTLENLGMIRRVPNGKTYNVYIA